MTAPTPPVLERIVQHGGRVFRVRPHHVERPENGKTPTIVVMSSTDTADQGVQYQAYGLVPTGWGARRWAVLGTPEGDPVRCLADALAHPWSSSGPDVLTRGLLDAAVVS
jgi:hypothetical protein